MYPDTVGFVRNDSVFYGPIFLGGIGPVVCMSTGSVWGRRALGREILR